MRGAPLPCDSEPIRIPGSIQPHGFLLVVDTDTQVLTRMSANAADRLGRPVESMLGKLWTECIDLDPATLDELLKNRGMTPGHVVYRALVVNGRPYNVVSHVNGDDLIIEFEDSDPQREHTLDVLYPRLMAAVERLQADQPVQKLYELATELVRDLTGFDRALIYRFDADGNGTVVGESRNDQLPSYFDLRFPGWDIPAQARELYRLNRIRLIPDVSYSPVPIIDADGVKGQPVDMTWSILRSVSPVHIEYMRNMATPASMSISILQDGKLWGLISCHHSAARHVPTQLRAACDFLGQIIAMQLTAKHQSAESAERVHRQELQSTLLALMSKEKDFVKGLICEPDILLALTDAQGAAVMSSGDCVTVGETPPEATLRDLADWLSTEHPGNDVFVSDCLSAQWPPGEAIVEVASGVLAISISQIHRSYVLWFRPELVQTVKWSGDPRTPKMPGGDHLHPRTSFETWKETVRRQSAAWSPAQVAAVTSLRNAVIGIVMRNAEEMADLTGELRRSNKELEAFSYSVSHDLRAPFRHIVGYAELLKEEESLRTNARAVRYVDTIIDSAHTAGNLVDGLLDFSQAGRSALRRKQIDVDSVCGDCLEMMKGDLKDREIEWDIGPLGSVVADPNMLRQVFQNLLSNAIKYTRDRDVARIRIRRADQAAEIVFSVEDNGVGFDMRYVSKLFGVFQRLHRMEEFEGTGIGLANVRRIAERHNGRTWAEGEVGRGATFYFALPNRGEPVNA